MVRGAPESILTFNIPRVAMGWNRVPTIFMQN